MELNDINDQSQRNKKRDSVMENRKICIFLRGINVNGIKIKMRDLNDFFIKLGFIEVKTILATGNIIISIGEAMEIIDLKEYIETELSKAFSYDAHVIIRSMSELKEICMEARKIELPEAYHLYVLLFDSEEDFLEVVTLFDTIHSFSEQLIPLNKDMLWIVAKGETLKSKFGSKILGNKKYKDNMTSRNLNTIEKMLL